MEKRGDFRIGESREDFDMTKKASIDSKSELDGLVTDLKNKPQINNADFLRLGVVGKLTTK